MSLFKHELQVPPRHEAVVNGQIVRQPVRVRDDDQVVFVSFDHALVTFPVSVRSREFLEFKGEARLRLSIPREPESILAQLLRDVGTTTWRKPFSLAAEQVAKAGKLTEGIAFDLGRIARAVDYFRLKANDDEDIGSRVKKVVDDQCTRCHLTGDLSIDFVPVPPSNDILADLSARAIEDKELVPVVRHLNAALLQLQLIAAQGEPDEVMRAKSSRTIAAQEEEEKVKANRDDIDKKQAERQKASNELNAQIQAASRDFEFEDKKKRRDEEKAIAQWDLEIAKTRAGEADVRRQQETADGEAQAAREEALSKIRIAEREAFFKGLEGIVSRLKEAPVPNYSGIHTLVAPGGGSQDSVAAPMWHMIATLLERFSASALDGVSSANDMSPSAVGKYKAPTPL